MPSNVTKIPDGNFDINALSFFSLAILSSSNFIFLTNSSPWPKIVFKIENEIIIIIVIKIRPINCLKDSGNDLNLFK